MLFSERPPIYASCVHTDANRFFTGKTGFLPVKNPLPFLPVKYKFYHLISETKIVNYIKEIKTTNFAISFMTSVIIIILF